MGTAQPGGNVNAAMATWDPEGYPKLAHLLGRLPEAVVLRRFAPLNMMTLLSLQAKLVMLDTDLWNTCYEDQKSTDISVEGYWKSFLEIHSETAPGNVRAEKLKTIQETLKEYYELLLLFSRVSELEHPRRDQTRFLQNWLRGEQEGKNFLKLKERFTWDNKYEFDFVVPVRSRSWVHPKLIELIHWIKKQFIRLVWRIQKVQQPPKRRNVDFFDVEIGKLGRVQDLESKAIIRIWVVVWTFAVVLIASMIPVLAVLVLYYIPETTRRIAAAVGMTAFAALFLRLFTSASVKEIFGATAAFAAIVVVFIGSANGKL